jgi:hypothetical protein
MIAAQNIIAFLWECAKAGLVPQLREVAPLLPTVMKALHEFPDCPSLVERAVGLAVRLGHQNRAKLVAAALNSFPESRFLKEIVAELREDAQ